jgi:phosphoribosylamine--glycine ligase
VRLLAPSQDHKQLLAGDQGPNTGGMGAYCPVPFCDDNILAAIRTSIVDPTLSGLQNEQFDFKGFLYFGIMLTPQGPKLLEYNVRLGDPEAEVLLPALESSLLELIEATLDGRLQNTVVRQRRGFYVGVVLASGGYPAAQFPTGFPITGLDQLHPSILAFHGATRQQDGQLVTTGGRVMVLVGHGEELEDAVSHVYREVERVKFKDVYIRTDIGQRPEPTLAGNW